MKKFYGLTLAVIFLLAAGIILTACKKEEENNNPTVTSVTVAPTSVGAGGIATVTVTASDPDGDALTYAYTATGGAITGAGNVATWTAPSTEGAYSVTVTVSDGKGGTATGAGTLTVEQGVTRVVGTAQFPAGTSGDLSNAKVSLYTSYANWNANQPIKFGAVTGSGASVSFELRDVLPGNYYLDIWKDIDNNAFWSSGDFVGWYGSGGLGSPNLTEFQITEGQTFSCSVSMFIVAKNSDLPK